MTKIFSIVLLAASVSSFAQVKLAAKANLLFKTDKATWENFSHTINDNGKNSTGFNVGLSAKINLPASLFIMPEIYYSTFKNEFTDPDTHTTLEAKSNRIDIPVLLGYNVLGDTVGLFLGPVASYNLAKEETFKDFKENALNNFTMGYQFGGQVMLKQLIFNARYEGAFSKDERKFVNSVTNSEYHYDSRPSMFLLGVGYQF